LTFSELQTLRRAAAGEKLATFCRRAAINAAVGGKRRAARRER
jgi:hypothetical protein